MDDEILHNRSYSTKKVTTELYGHFIMGRVKETSAEKRAQIDILHQEGYSQRIIAARMGVSLSCVSKTLKRIKEMNNFQSRKRSGRPKKTTVQTDRLIRRLCVSHPFASSSEIRANLPSDSLNICSTSTIRRRLIKSGLRAYKPAKKPFLSRKNIIDRLAFCERYRHLTLNDWSNVMFSDETKISQFHSNRPTVRRPRNQRFSPKYTVKTVRSAASVMIWGAISMDGRCGLHFIPRGSTLKARDYLAIIQEKVLQFMALRGTSILQQDGAPCHNAKLVKHWIDEQDEWQLLEGWPGNSPDLNPIENCWVKVKKCVDKHSCSSYEELIDVVKRVWIHEITPDYCRKLIESMPQRLLACMKNKGSFIKY